MAWSPQKKEDFFTLIKMEYQRCLDPTMQCPGKPIRAHSVQNATALSFIENNNHVYQMRLKFSEEIPSVQLELVGRNTASTFKGLCSKHDNEIFAPIDNHALDEQCQEQLFLIAYRSVTREVHATLEGAMKIQSAYLKQVDRGEVSRDQPSAVGMEALSHMLKAWAAWKYRFKYFDRPLIDRDFRTVRHVTFALEGKAPVLACSSFFSLDFKPWGEPFAALIVNIIPTSSDRTLVIFSFAARHRSKATRHISQIVRATGGRKEYELSCLILDRAENFFLSPYAVDSWSDEKRSEIIAAFAHDILGRNPLSNDPLVRTTRLNLFEIPQANEVADEASQ